MRKVENQNYFLNLDKQKFKKFLSRDPVQLNLLYEQAKEAILDGTHPVPLETAIQFGALQVQIQFGDHKEDKHKPGMLAE